MEKDERCTMLCCGLDNKWGVHEHGMTIEQDPSPLIGPNSDGGRCSLGPDGRGNGCRQQ